MAATTVLWGSSAFWSWSILTVACIIALAIAGTLLSKRDTPATRHT
ncbi:hypothetical protein [Cryobacterium sp. M23]|nr:hypothetical protein [Cryobacterium sp. M23]